MSELCDRLRSLRAEKRLEQSELATSLGISISALQKYETGNMVPPKHKQGMIAEFFGVSLDYLQGKSDDRGDGIEIHAHRDPNTRGMQVSDAIDIVDKLERLVKLKESGSISEEEFKLFKRKLLK